MILGRPGGPGGPGGERAVATDPVGSGLSLDLVAVHPARDRELDRDRRGGAPDARHPIPRPDELGTSDRDHVVKNGRITVRGAAQELLRDENTCAVYLGL